MAASRKQLWSLAALTLGTQTLGVLAGCRQDVGKPGTTLVTVDAAGEKLGSTMAEFLKALRAEGRMRNSSGS